MDVGWAPACQSSSGEVGQSGPRQVLVARVHQEPGDAGSVSADVKQGGKKVKFDRNFIESKLGDQTHQDG